MAIEPQTIFQPPTSPTKTEVLCFINQKGGCGKSSSCFNLGGHLAASGKEVLLIDLDPQGSLSQGFFGSTTVENYGLSETVAALFSDESSFIHPALLVKPTSKAGLSILPSNNHLASFNLPNPERYGLQQQIVSTALEDLPSYDYVIVDCPPNLYQCSWNALLAADWVVIPVPPKDFGTQGLRTVHQAIGQAQQLNPKLNLLGHLISRKDGRLVIHQEYEKRLRELYGESVLQTCIPEASAFKVSLAGRQPVSYFAPHSKAGLSITALAHEIEQRIATTKELQHVS